MEKTAKYYQKNREARLKRLRQQAKYNRTNKGKLLITRAQKLRRKLGIPKGSKMDAAHYKGSTSKGRPQHRSINRKSRTK
jgi:alcohol dehydrogenase class IV